MLRKRMGCPRPNPALRRKPDRNKNPWGNRNLLGWAQIAPPAQLIASTLGTDNDVEASVAVQIDDDGLGYGPLRLQYLHVPRSSGVTTVFEDRHPFFKAPCGGDHLQSHRRRQYPWGGRGAVAESCR